MKIVNLNKVRKSRALAEKKRIADENAVKHGRTKAERVLDAARNEITMKRLSDLQFDDE